MAQYGFLIRILDYRIIRTPQGYTVTNKNGLTLKTFKKYQESKEYIKELEALEHGTIKDN